MTEGARSRGLDPERLTAYLRALAVPNRVELLRKLQVPRTIGEIELRPARHLQARSPDRRLAWQTVESHVKKLQELGLVHARASQRGGRSVKEYVVNHARLFLIVEELRLLGLLRPAPGVGLDTQTGTGPLGPSLEAQAPPLPEGPALVLPAGPLEGTAFPLRGQGPWVIGRAPGLAVSLPYDPFVSAENSEVRRGPSGFVIRDLPGSHNGTRVNWRRLAAGEEVLLCPGDAVGVGRSVLVFRDA